MILKDILHRQQPAARKDAKAENLVKQEKTVTSNMNICEKATGPNHYLSMLILNVNGLNSDTDCLNVLKKKKRPISCLHKNMFQHQRYIQTESDSVYKIIHDNGNQKEAGVVILLSHNIDFKTNS